MAYFIAAVISPTLPVFATAHLVSSIIGSSLHWWLWSRRLPDYIESIWSILPGIDPATDSYFNEKQVSRFRTFVIQGLFKQILTEGERYVVTFFYLLSLAQQGVWDSVTAIGALFPRFVFRPLEESFYLHFCNNPSGARRDLPVILRLSLLMGLICICIGLPQSWSILYVYGGENIAGSFDYYMGHVIAKLKASHAPYLLQLSFVNTFVCALNGILEGKS